MQLHSKGSRYVVFDDVLHDDQLAMVREAFGVAPLRPTLSAIDRFHDGMCYTAPGPEGSLGHIASSVEAEVVRTLATYAADAVGERIDIGTPQSIWAYSTFYAAYPVGTKLGWHDDGAERIAAFIYYPIHWSSDWGGELDLLDCEPETIPATGELAHSVTGAPCNMTSIVPRLNRLVVMPAPTVHRIRRVDQLAGTHIRQSISGFLSATIRKSETA